MKYHHTAKGLAALGRNGDDVLMHVNKDELAGLESLLGPISVNPETGLPEAFSWGPVLGSAVTGLLGAFGGGPIAAALGFGGNALAAGAAGAGLGAISGGAISAMQGHGFKPGALGGAISGGMGGYGGMDLTEAPNKNAILGATTAPEEAMKRVGTSKVWQQSMLPGYEVTPEQYGQSLASLGKEPTLSSFKTTAPTDIGDALSKQGSAMMTKSGMESLIKPVGLGVVTGTMMEEAMLGNELARQQQKQREQEQQQAQAQAQANAQDQQNYFSSLGFPLPTSSDITSKDTATQRNYYLNLLYPSGGYAAGGPVTANRVFAGVPIQTTFPAKYVDEFERTNLQKEIPEQYQGLQQFAENIGLAAEKSAARGMANGGYLNNAFPMPEDGMHPQSLIPQAQPNLGATPIRRDVLNNISDNLPNYAEGGSVYDKGGFLDGPGDGMSDDIPANIDGQEEVRLADGEFVVPPEIVSMLGYGDPEKGAKMLDKLLPMVRQAAHGKKDQIKQDAGKKAVEKALIGGLPKKKSLAAEKAEARKKARG